MVAEGGMHVVVDPQTVGHVDVEPLRQHLRKIAAETLSANKPVAKTLDDEHRYTLKLTFVLK